MTLFTAQPLFAEEIIVETTADEMTTNNLCSLREAVYSANQDSNANTPDCPAGTGADTIVLTGDTYTLSRTTGSYDVRDLTITDSDALTITGAGVGATIIDVGSLSGTTAKRVFGVSANAVLNVENLTITGGNVNGDGGGMQIASGAVVTLRNVNLSSNDASDDGGAVANSGTLNIFDSTIQNNTAQDNGGGIYNLGTLTVSGSLFAENDANDRGGGIMNTDSATITNSTFSANRVINGSANRGGGAISNEDSDQMSLAYVTLVNNSAQGSAIGSSITTRDGDVTVMASIIVSAEADNCATDGGSINGGGYNIENGSSCDFIGATDLSNTDPLLGALVNGGGPTFVHPIEAGSPAIDFIPSGDAECGGAIVVDQRGQPRPQDGNADLTADCDAGAYEVLGENTGGAIDPVDVTVLTTVIDSGAGPLSGQPLGLDPVNTRYRFFVEIENLDPIPAYGVIVHDTLINLLGATVNEIQTDAGWSCSFGGSQLLCSYTGELIGNGNPTPVAEVDITLDPAQPSGVITHYLQASTLNPDNDLSNNSCDINNATVDTADDCITFTVQGQADLAINKRALTPSAAPGGFLLYEIEVVNNGPWALPAATVTDTISSGPGVVVGASPNCTIGAQTVCTVTDLAVGERRSLLVSLQVNANANPGVDTITNCAEVTDFPSGANQSCDTAAVVAPAQAADLAVTGVTLTSAPFTPGAPERFEVAITNNGPADAQGVLVYFACDAIGDFDVTNFSTSGPAPWAPSDGIFVRSLPLPGNSSETLTFDVTAPADAHLTAAGLIDNCTATISAINPDPTPANNSGNAALASQVQADLSLTKTLLTPSVAAAGLAIYNIELCNVGPSDAAGVSVVDTLGANLVLGSDVFSADLTNITVRAGQCASALLTAEVTAAAAPGASFANSAQVTVDSVTAAGNTSLPAVINQPSVGPVSGAVAVALTSADIQAVAVTDLTAAIVAGQSYQFQIGVENAGPAQAQGVTVHDLLQGLPGGWTATAIQTAPNWVCSAGLSCTRSGAMPVQAETVATVTVTIPAQTVAGTYSHQLAASANNPGDLASSDAVSNFDVVTTAALNIAVGDLNENRSSPVAAR
ncbi:MAG: choice-of-anchor Q domain-containing protein [Caldilineaceae bacterium]